MQNESKEHSKITNLTPLHIASQGKSILHMCLKVKNKVLLRKNNLMIFSYLATIGLISMGMPMMLFKRDIWDGVIIEYNLREESLESLRTWLFTSGWELQYYVIGSQELLSKVFNTPLRGFILTTSLVALIILAYEVYLLAKNSIRMTRTTAVFCSTLLLVQPTWNVLVSSVMNIHIICLSLGIMGTRLFYDVKANKRILGILLILFSFQLNSMMLFIPTLISVIELNERNNRTQNALKKRNFFIVLGMAVTYFLVQRIFNPNEGAYLYYNEIIIPNSPEEIRLYVKGIINFSSFLIIPFLAIALHLPKFLSRHSLVRENTEYPWKKISYLLILFASAATPYVLVGKSTNIFDLTDWGQRQSFLVVVPLVLLTGLLTSDFADGAKIRRVSWTKVSQLIVLIIFSLSLLLSSFGIKLNRQIFEQQLAQAMQEVIQNPKPGLMQINGVGIPGPTFRTYESNYLLYEAYSRASWWSVIQKNLDKNFSLPAEQDLLDAGIDVYQPSLETCTSLVTIKANGFERPFENVFRYVLEKASSSVRVLEFKTFCDTTQVFYFKESKQ